MISQIRTTATILACTLMALIGSAQPTDRALTPKARVLDFLSLLRCLNGRITSSSWHCAFTTPARKWSSLSTLTKRSIGLDGANSDDIFSRPAS